MRYLVLVFVLLLASCSDLIDVIVPVDTTPFLPQERVGVHMHPNGADCGDVQDAAGTFPMIRMQAPGGAERYVEALIACAPTHARFLLLLSITSDPRIVTRLSMEPKVIGWELENEPDNFLGWAPEEYVAWVDAILPEIAGRKGDHQILVSAATVPLVHEWDRILKWNQRLIELGVLNGFDVYNIHVYGRSWSKLPEVRDTIERARSMVRLHEVWVTETGSPDSPVEYFRQTPGVWALHKILPERWFIYAYIDDHLGYSLKVLDGDERVDGPLLIELKEEWGLNG